jgi:hypothetical protein
VRIWVNGSDRINLPKKSYVGQGGQASVYAQSGVAYKIYTDPKTMIPEAKMAELAAIQDPRVIKPEFVISTTKHGSPIGYTMRHIQDSFVLCQLFSRAFRTRHGIDAAQISHLVDELRAGIESVHRAGALLVDGNELNFLVSRDFKKLFFVDVDSYQTQSYPAMAIMDSIRDRHQAAGSFSEGSDWFSFAIVAFQLFVGIHPFKGKHESCRGFDARMKANLSVFSPEVRVPKSTYAFSSIPAAYRRWFEQVFEEGARTPPPTSTSAAITTAFVAKAVRSGASLNYQTLETRASAIRNSYASGPHLITVTATEIWNHNRRMATTPEHFVGIAFGSGNRPLSVSADKHGIRVEDLESKTSAILGLALQSAVTSDGRIYAHHGGMVSEVRVLGAGASMSLTLALAVNVLPHATQLWPGFVFQNLLGTAYLSLLPKAGFSYQVAVPELSGATLIDARFEGNVLVATAHREGQMDRLVLRFDEAFQRYDCRVTKDVEVATANLSVLDTGLCLCLNEDEELEIFRCQMGSTKLELIADTSLCGEMKLSSRGAQALVTSQGSLYRIEMA